jgi:hypothetical protein
VPDGEVEFDASSRDPDVLRAWLLVAVAFQQSTDEILKQVPGGVGYGAWRVGVDEDENLGVGDRKALHIVA